LPQPVGLKLEKCVVSNIDVEAESKAQEKFKIKPPRQNLFKHIPSQT